MFKFSLGQLVMTPAAMDYMLDHNVNYRTLLKRHLSGDWGDMCAEDKQANDEALNPEYPTRVFSSYKLGPDKVWIITEANREYSTILLPSDY